MEEVLPVADQSEKTAIKWHPGFYGAAELELSLYRDVLEFQREYNLSKEPLRVDLLIIKKTADVPIENEIGHIFKRYNVVEYKSPEDGLSIDDYYKTIGYACLYKGLGETVDKVPAEELTVSIFREGYPRELFEALKKQRVEAKERFPGIYYLHGNVPFDTQIITTGRLSPEAHSGLRILSKRAREEDVRRFIQEAKRLTRPGDRNNADAVLQASIAANERLYDEIRRESGMCEALRELMKDEIDRSVAEAVAETREAAMAEGLAQGLAEGTDNAILSAIANLMDTMKITAEQAMEAIKVPLADRSRYASRL